MPQPPNSGNGSSGGATTYIEDSGVDIDAANRAAEAYNAIKSANDQLKDICAAEAETGVSSVCPEIGDGLKMSPNFNGAINHDHGLGGDANTFDTVPAPKPRTPGG